MLGSRTKAWAMLTPNGLSVRSRILRISSRTASSSPDDVSMMPSPPALETAEASWDRAIHPIGACTIGYSTPSSSVTRLTMAGMAPERTAILRFLARLQRYSGQTGQRTVGLEGPAGRPARLDGGEGGRPPGGDAVDEPGRRTGRRGAELGRQRGAGLVDPGRPAGGGPAGGHVGDRRRIGDPLRLALDDQVELVGGQAERAAGIAGHVLPLAGGAAGLEPERTVDPQRADAGDVGAAVRVDRGQPAGVAVRSARARRLGHALFQPALDGRQVDRR